MHEQPLRVAVIIGSTRQGRFGDTVAGWFVDLARRRRDLTLDLVDLREADLPAVYPAERDEAVTAYARRIEAADAFVVVTPEYNHSFPAGLKQAIDLCGREWRRKPVAFIAYGGRSGGLRAVEHLRQVFAELHAVTIRDTVSFHGASACFHADGRPRDPDGTAAAATVLLDDLVWWARVLRDARREVGPGRRTLAS